jgi:enoyl-CoA hydratase/carnithine racemase
MTQNFMIKEIKGSIAILELNRPKQANALNRDLFVSLKEELDVLQWEDGIKVVMITGAGEKAFCAGIDLKERAQKEKSDILHERERVIRPFYLALGNFPKPTIAALNGPALGGGAELALSCDIRVASPMAKFGLTEVKWGMIPSCGACQRLRLITGMGVAKEIILTGRVLEAEEAYRLGIYNRMVKREKVMEEAMNLAEEISENPPLAVKQAKKVLELGADMSLALDLDFEASKECFFAGDAMEKPKSF